MMLYPMVMVLLVIMTDILLISLWTKKNKANHLSENLPIVSVLVAARNEEFNIVLCLKSLINQNYPKEKLQILVGDDDSSDDTYQVAKKALGTYTFSEVISITESISHQKGKANVLAQLASMAQGEYLFIADADMQLPSSWAKHMLRQFDTETGIVTGVTHTPDDLNQSCDWLFALGMVKVLHDYNIPVTTMGNNMVISKEAYSSVGGYENIPFSITEDLELFKQVSKKGYKVKQVYDRKALGLTKPIFGFKNILEQRKRWMLGAIQLPWPIVLILFIQALYFPSVMYLLISNFVVSSILLVTKTVVQGLFLYACHKRLKLKLSLKQLINHELYSWILSCASLIYFFIPAKVSWKGRKY